MVGCDLIREQKQRTRRWTRKSAQRLMAATSRSAREAASAAAFTSSRRVQQPGKVNQGAAECVEVRGAWIWPDNSEAHWLQERELVPSHLLLAAVRRAHPCRTASRTVRCPWKARQKRKEKHAVRAEKRWKYRQSRAVEKWKEVVVVGGGDAIKSKFGFNEADPSPPGGRLDYHWVSDSIWVMLGVRRGAQTSPGPSCVCACLSASVAEEHGRDESRDETLGGRLGGSFSASLRRPIAACLLRNRAWEQKYGWWCLGRMQQGFITPQAAVTAGESPSPSQLGWLRPHTEVLFCNYNLKGIYVEL